eukprot:CAMPEP_0185725560 /NCGR_PEP_ID=MMETSP1171-20130828/1788_1 /TAXON_ID=374046 /ORGANISM="Helicotheca tamensis, Strain CCMP826" /LENGTH=336 /DNA_ID=CAMNT_0028393713 /DNA_START=91 /DNA_END=1101 /DNA_ORIENTATION=-
MTDSNQNDVKRRKVDLEDKELYDLLNLDDENVEGRKMLDAEAVIRVVRQKPWLATKEYTFSTDGLIYFPLIKAIKLRAPIEVIYALCCPEAMDGTTQALLFAIRHLASFDAVKLLLEKQPKLVKEQAPYSGFTPLHYACMRAPLETVSLLLDEWPEAAKEQRSGCLPLHYACRYATAEVVSLLLKIYPEAVRKKDMEGDTPLHAACYEERNLDLIVLLLDSYPETIQETNYDGNTPVDIAEERNAPEDIAKLLSYTSILFDDELQKETLEEIMSFFTEIQWWRGIWLIFKRHPAATQTINLDTGVKAHFLSAAGRFCKLTSMWEVIRNEQDLLADV